MRKHFGSLICALLLVSVTIISWKPVINPKRNITLSDPYSARELLDKYVGNIYESAHLQESGLALKVFEKAMTGLINLKAINKISQNNSILTVIDFAKSSCEKRMWIIDVASKELLLNTWVAHGSGSGDDIPQHFSDDNDSHASSLGFYLTDDVYEGKHGRSLRLDGLDEGFNASARLRSIVIHAAPYVSKHTIEEHGRLGHSFGCPAVSPHVLNRVIENMKNKTLLFISGNDDTYSSKYLDENLAVNYIAGADTSYIANLQ